MMRVLRAFAVVLATVAGVLTAADGAVAAGKLPGARYTSLPSPVRILDTRTPVGGHPGQVGLGETVRLTVPDLPPDTSAVVINLTGTGGSTPTHLSTFPTEYTGTSTLNLARGQTAAVAAFVTLGRGQTVNIRNDNGNVHVIADLAGYFAVESGAGLTSAPSPARILDTRTPLGGHARPVAAGEVMTLRVRGAAGVPADATAVVVNVTAVGPTASAHIGVTPDGRLGTSTLNVDRGATRANLAVVGIGQDGAIRIYNSAGSVHVVADVQGWFTPTGGGRYMTLPAPQRVLDTRDHNEPITAGGTRPVEFAPSGVPAIGRTAVLFNLTGVQPTTPTYLTAWPSNKPRPETSNVNLDAGAIVPNAAVSDTSTVNIYSPFGSIHVVIDAVGYFYTPTQADPGVPGAPTVTAVGRDDDRVHVRWSFPQDGGVPITGYTVTMQPGGLTHTVHSGRPEVRLAGLHPGINYTATVTATNLLGTGPASAPSSPVTAPSLARLDREVPIADLPGPYFQSMSGDGRYALFNVNTGSHWLPPRYRVPSEYNNYLMRLNIQGATADLVSLKPDGNPAIINASAINQDGTVVAFSSRHPDGRLDTIYVRNLRTNTTRPILVAPAGLWLSSLDLSADAHWLSWTFVDDSRGRWIYRHNLGTNQTTELFSCPDPSTGCYVYTGPEVSADGRKFVFAQRETPSAPFRLKVLDAETGQSHALTEDSEGYVLSGDGNWLFYTRGAGCPSCPPGSYQLKKIATTPEASPILLRSWQDSVTWGVYPRSANEDGTLVGYFRQTGEPGQWFAAAPGYIYDTTAQRETTMPQARSNAYVGAPALNTAGTMAVIEEHCFWGESCYPTGTYILSLPELRTPARQGR